MPTAAIEIRRQYSHAEETAIINAVQAAMVAALKVPPWTTVIRLFVHAPHRFVCAQDKGDRYTLEYEVNI